MGNCFLLFALFVKRNVLVKDTEMVAECSFYWPSPAVRCRHSIFSLLSALLLFFEFVVS